MTTPKNLLLECLIGVIGGLIGLIGAELQNKKIWLGTVKRGGGGGGLVVVSVRGPEKWIPWIPGIQTI